MVYYCERETTVVGTGRVHPGSARAERHVAAQACRNRRNLEPVFEPDRARAPQALCRDPDIKDELKRALPETLEELAALARSERVNLTDPETGKRYTYTVKDETTYELCATFSLPRDSDVEVFWNHPPGRHCFTVNALDPP